MAIEHVADPPKVLTTLLFSFNQQHSAGVLQKIVRFQERSIDSSKSGDVTTRREKHSGGTTPSEKSTKTSQPIKIFMYDSRYEPVETKSRSLE